MSKFFSLSKTVDSGHNHLLCATNHIPRHLCNTPTAIIRNNRVADGVRATFASSMKNAWQRRQMPPTLESKFTTGCWLQTDRTQSPLFCEDFLRILIAMHRFHPRIRSRYVRRIRTRQKEAVNKLIRFYRIKRRNEYKWIPLKYIYLA